MFITINRIENSITGSVNGESFGVAFKQERWDLMKELAAKANKATTMEELKATIEEFKPLTVETFKDLVEHKTPHLYVNASRGTYHLKIGSGDTELISSEPLPQAFVDRIVKSVEKDIDVLPLVKCWVRFLRNPFYSRQKAKRFANYINKTYVNHELATKLKEEHGVTHEVAIERSTTFQTPITDEGLICTYKVSAELTHKFVLDENGQSKQVPIKEAEIDEITGVITYKDPEHVEDRIFYPVVQGLSGGNPFYCGDKLGHIIKVGQRHRLETWDHVNTNDNLSCVPGLHTGNLDYIRGYQRSGTVTHDVFVDPMFIGAITDDGTGALRVLEYYVHRSHAGVNRSIYFSSDYAKVTDEEYEKMFEEAVKVSTESAEASDLAMKEKKALRTTNG